MLRVICFLCTILGAIIMTRATYKYYKLVKYLRAESYQSLKTSKSLQDMLLAAMIFFIVGYFVGAFDIYLRDVEPIFLFVVVVFFVGGLFVAAMIDAQTKMAVGLRGKTMEVMKTLVNTIEMKDPYTKGHSQHVYDIVELFHEALPEECREKLNKPKLLDAALLHDIGKIGVRDGILNKKGPLSAQEWEVIRTHPSTGKRLLDDTCFSEISDWVLYHHERMDGRGYFALNGNDIPIESRIIAIADTYSALSTDREYRPKTDHASALRIMKAARSEQFDENLLDCFAQIPAQNLKTLNDRHEERRRHNGATDNNHAIMAI